MNGYLTLSDTNEQRSILDRLCEVVPLERPADDLTLGLDNEHDMTLLHYFEDLRLSIAEAHANEHRDVLSMRHRDGLDIGNLFLGLLIVYEARAVSGAKEQIVFRLREPFDLIRLLLQPFEEIWLMLFLRGNILFVVVLF